MLRHVRWAAVWLLLTAAAAVAQQEKVIDRIVAVVDNEIILESELSQYMQFQVGSQAALDAMTPAQVESLKTYILDELINQKVLLAKARADTVKVEARLVDAELDARIKALVDQAGGQDKLEQYYGMPLAKLKRQFRPMVEDGMLIDKVRQEKLKDVKVGPAEVLRFWETYKDSIPPLRDGVRIAHILLQDSVSPVSVEATMHLADSLRQIIVSGKMTFEDCARQFSQDPGTADKGGLLGQTNRGELVPEYEAAAYALKPGEISQPVLSPFGVHIIRLDERLGEKILTHHILLKVAPTDSDLMRTEALADSIVRAARGGADFGELAMRYSADRKTAIKGGDLGWFAPDELPVDFKGPLTDVAKDSVIAPVRTRFGVHIVKVTDRMYARAITLSEDYDRIAAMALAKKKDDVYQKWVQDLAAQTYIEKK
jgi:peptidyl-prolyl cis-trans isomerase SurA